MSALCKKMRHGGRIMILFLLLVCAGLMMMEQNISQTLLDTAFARAYSMAVETLNSAVQKVMDSGITYEELVETLRDTQGKVSMIRANTVRMNALAAQTALIAEKELNSFENQFVEVPLGAAFGIRFLSGFGPRLSVQILPVGAVHSSYEAEFETAGINQTRHKVFLSLRATVNLIIPTGSERVEVTTTIPVAESIIVGDVPESFVDVNERTDMLEFIP